MRLIIAGSRHFTDYALLRDRCDALLKNTTDPIEIVSGTAKGADQLGERYAKERGHLVKLMPADWQHYGRKAGYLRNVEMAKYATHCICFWDGKSPGTKMMIEIANNFNLKLRTVKV